MVWEYLNFRLLFLYSMDLLKLIMKSGTFAFIKACTKGWSLLFTIAHSIHYSATYVPARVTCYHDHQVADSDHSGSVEAD